ncbi:MAG TPA: type ISP restriction/modification enzyme, partial [Flavitalea sp.]|nr:type ISP restriction/modification enzyme [Flavitalea sp.]
RKFAKGYPSDNILFEDSQVAVLYQHGEEIMRVNMKNEKELDAILNHFLQYERPEVHEFRNAIERFKEDIPKVTVAIREIIEAQQLINNDMQSAQERFLSLAKESINPEIGVEDLKEMIIQHILSADIFNTIFDDPHFHQENNIAKELSKVIDTFFTGENRRRTLGSIKHYYDTINARAASIADHHEKQKFLKVVYENFYKGYNPKAADRLGIVYTPNELVHFMIRSTDFLLHKHFSKTFADSNVEVLDPATGTGTFITDLIDYIPKSKLPAKYKNELHANEIGILPYYIANLNIEYTYAQKMGEYAQFNNLCFVDTLDNTGFQWVGKQGSLFGLSTENTHRVINQNQKRISVIIGNPPYNAKQENYNLENANRTYREVDKRIKNTFIKFGKARSQIVLYDMYVRFYRWAMDRINENGIIAFVTNRSFIDGRAFDGFRKTIQEDFASVYIIDTKSDVRANPKIAGSTHNIFGIQTGVAVMFLVKNVHSENRVGTPKMSYHALDDTWTRSQKLHWFANNEIERIEFQNLAPDSSNNWINNVENDWEKLIPLFGVNTAARKGEEVVFKNSTLGIATHRDAWVYDLSKVRLEVKVKRFLKIYDESRKNGEAIKTIAWDEDLIRLMRKNVEVQFSNDKFVKSSFRPFVSKWLYYDNKLISRIYSFSRLYQQNDENVYINFRSLSSDDELACLASAQISDLGYLKTGNGGTFVTGLYCYTPSGQKECNITDWALRLFREYYGDSAISERSIFHYVYAVLYHPLYRKTYETNLRRALPRIPLYNDFGQWETWGGSLMDLHLNYELVEPYKLERIDDKTNLSTKFKLKSKKDAGVIIIDDITELRNIPAKAWEYKIGNRSALDWILEQYKEKKTTVQLTSPPH